MQGPFLRKYGVETKIPFDLFEADGVDFKTDAVHASGDTKIMKDEGDEINTTNGFADEGQTYSIIISATEMEAARIKIPIVDQGTKVWLDDSIVIETYGHASAMHAMDLDAAQVDLTSASIDAIWDEVLTGATHNDATSAGRRLREASDVSIIRSVELAQGGTTTTITLNGNASSINDFYNGCVIIIIDGTGIGQARIVTAYVGSTRIADICIDWVTAPDNSSKYVLRGHGGTVIHEFLNGVITKAAFSSAMEARLAELDAVNLPADIDAIKAKTDNQPAGIPKNVALPQFVFVMASSSDHVTPKTGLTVTAEISKDGGSDVTATNNVVELSHGRYKVTGGFTQAEMNADILALRFSAPGADDRNIIIKTSS